jgi:hypothetical protein
MPVPASFAPRASLEGRPEGQPVSPYPYHFLAQSSSIVARIGAPTPCLQNSQTHQQFDLPLGRRSPWLPIAGIINGFPPALFTASTMRDTNGTNPPMPRLAAVMAIRAPGNENGSRGGWLGTRSDSRPQWKLARSVCLKKLFSSSKDAKSLRGISDFHCHRWAIC